MHVIAELTNDAVAALADWAGGGSSNPRVGESAEIGELRSYLRAIGALIWSDPPKTELSWVTVGPEAPAAALRQAVEQNVPSGIGSLTLVIRTNNSLGDLSDRAHSISDPHLLIDMTGHHTISLGPFVTPPLTACIGCYAGRLAERWGDDHAVPEPASQRWIGLVSDLVSIQLGLIEAGTSPLVNGTINWDLRSGRSHRDDLLRYSACTLCYQGAQGSLALPWDQNSRAQAPLRERQE